MFVIKARANQNYAPCNGQVDMPRKTKYQCSLDSQILINSLPPQTSMDRFLASRDYNHSYIKCGSHYIHSMRFDYFGALLMFVSKARVNQNGAPYSQWADRPRKITVQTDRIDLTQDLQRHLWRGSQPHLIMTIVRCFTVIYTLCLLFNLCSYDLKLPL